jgi:DNA-binding MarR family transcriptional regulator
MSHDTSIAQVRRFNRVITQRVGALNDQYLSRSRTLGASRVLWEIGVEGCEVRSLRSRLGLDSGQASRLLRALESDGLIEVAPSAMDGRVRFARLTRAGIGERAVLDERSDELARSILDPLDQPRRDRLVEAMRTIERLITASAVDLRVVDPSGAEARACLRAYFAELNRRSEIPFDPAKGTSAEPHELRAPAGAFVIAYLREEPIGCGAVKHHPDRPSEIKRMWVAESARGLGIGRRLLGELERLAGAAGAAVVRLDTNKSLVEAISMYRSAGYRAIPRFNEEPFAHHWFEKRLH